MLVLRLLISCLIMVPSFARADVYSFVDDVGVSHYSNVPDDARYTLLLRTASPETLDLPATSPTIATTTNQKDVSFIEYLSQAAKDNQLDAELLHAVITVESAYNPLARSPKGALGLMQLMPATAKRYGVEDALDPRQNIAGGAKYLRELLTLFNNDMSLALAAYNSGENAVIKYGNKIPPYRETIDYVPRVMKIYNGLRQAKKVNG